MTKCKYTMSLKKECCVSGMTRNALFPTELVEFEIKLTKCFRCPFGVATRHKDKQIPTDGIWLPMVTNTNAMTAPEPFEKTSHLDCRANIQNGIKDKKR